MDLRTKTPTLAICICTVDRPDVLRRCLDSIAGGSRRPDIVLVSDDSRDGWATQAVCAEYDGVRYLAGPRRGLCANRNAIIDAAATDFVSLLDDDAVVSEDFVAGAYAALQSVDARTLITGSVIENGERIVAANPSFLGYFTAPTAAGRRNINLNCNVLPRSAFDHARFDENIGYGYEDMDVCSRLISLGYAIAYDAALVNTHLPPAKNQSQQRARALQTNRARFYTSVKRYLLWEQKPLKLLGFVAYAPLHRAAVAVRTGRWYDIGRCVPDMAIALATVLRERRALSQPVQRERPAA